MTSHTGASQTFLHSTLVDVARHRAATQPEQVAYRFSAEEGGETLSLTYGELDRKARAIAAKLQSEASGVALAPRVAHQGERALLLFPPDLDYITAFLGCLYAGIVAVPSYPPRPNRRSERIEAILADARPTFILTTDSIRAHTERWLPELPDGVSPRWLTIDDFATDGADNWQEPEIDQNSLAFLQYTSGSTAVPRGVMLTHANLLHNLEQIQQAFQTGPHTNSVFWLPLYHDMGLIGGVLGTLHCGGTATLLPAVAFLQRPFRWLQTIAQTRANLSGAPNFAYELCVQKITPEQRALLDLSCWKTSFNGSEPIRADTLQRFAETFAPCGFRPETMYPCYGLAEATLIVSGSRVDEPPVIAAFDAAALEQNQVVPTDDAEGRTLVSSGKPLSGHKVHIVDPQSNTICPSGKVGEIWVASPSVAQGYWQRGEDSENTFGARLADRDDGPFLRTGDLGFLHGGELFVTGRLKDLIILRGRNYYPQDIEWTVQQSHPALRPDACAVFAVEVDGEERLVVVQEVERGQRKANGEEVIAAIRQAVSRQHELNVYAVRLLKPMALPKTSSGKIQRHASRQAFLADTLDAISSWTREIPSSERGCVSAPCAGTPCAGTPRGELLSQLHSAPEGERHDLLLTFLQTASGDALGLSPSQPIDPTQALRDLGFDSLMAINVCDCVGTALDRSLPATLLFDFPTLNDLTVYLLHDLFPDVDLADAIAQIEGLSEAELDAILREHAV